MQLGRLDYQPQTAPALANANSIDFGDLEVSQSQIEGGADIIQRCFPNTYGEPLVEITAAKGKTIHLAKKIGVAFCGRYVDTWGWDYSRGGMNEGIIQIHTHGPTYRVRTSYFCGGSEQGSSSNPKPEPYNLP